MKKHTILYDAECPMCGFYTSAFVKAGMLDATGRIPYQDMPASLCRIVDRQRAVNEIALVNEETGEVSYGIKSLFTILANAFPIFKPLFSNKLFIWVMSKLYAFVSYNRRIIIPVNQHQEKVGVQPSFRKGYRIAYLFFTWLVTAFILSRYTMLMNELLPAGSIYREYLVCGGQIFFQGIIAGIYFRKRAWDYLGNMMTISLGGALLLLPIGLLSYWIHVPAILYAGVFLFVAGIMLLEHIRRTKLLQIGWTLTISWVVYRLLVLLIILK